ncbi:hypothetical protein ElyMa_002630200 [Elysia marginata]|uniref:Uncharacterized protein n=1 Tax=Elysia marginata TaxID=1093978 RepID=A0AAV4H819_9GAST|nr:hypothetical protein ElyMa_002630200 [Elysia marginata]
MDIYFNKDANIVIILDTSVCLATTRCTQRCVECVPRDHQPSTGSRALYIRLNRVEECRKGRENRDIILSKKEGKKDIEKVLTNEEGSPQPIAYCARGLHKKTINHFLCTKNESGAR